MAQPIWNTPAGNIGAFASGAPIRFQLSAFPVPPAISLTYQLISGQLPAGVSINNVGLILGNTQAAIENTTYTFTVRVTDDTQNIRDRTFSIIMSGVDSPEFTTPAGTILTTFDSLWVEQPIEYSVPIPNTEVIVNLVQGRLPPGLEINEFGLIRGYPNPPVINVSLGSVDASVLTIIDNTMIASSTVGFSPGRPITFNGDIFGGVAINQTYYVREILDSTTFTISTTVNGPVYELNNDAGFMNAFLPNISVGQPTIRTYNFTLKLITAFGEALESYSIVIINQNASNALGGPGRPFNTRIPTILNTRPLSYNILVNDIDYRFYLFPPNSRGETYDPTQLADIGRFNSDDKFAFQVLGKDFDGNELEYVFANLPLGLVGDSTTGWVTGNPMISPDNINEFTFSVAVRKRNNPSITTPSFNFSFVLRNSVDGEIIWVTPSDLGIVFDGTDSTLAIAATSDVPLQYSVVSGTLPPNLSLLSTGELAGTIASQPNEFLVGADALSYFTFTVRASSPNFAIVTSDRTFTVTVEQLFPYPVDNIYIKCTPGIADRDLLATLLDNEALIPNEMIYRPQDNNFGKATSVIYDHAFGINASSFNEYVAAVTINHYWRQLTLGEIKTAVARNEETGEIIYEVVYSSVIDNLVNPQNVSVSKEVYWPRFIPLNLGPWYTSDTDIFTSYVGQNDQLEFYTSLTPGFARLLYPNSLPNMREQVEDVLGTVNNTNILPLWMTSQQLNGSTLGFAPAWVITYCKPGILVTSDNLTTAGDFITGQLYTIKSLGDTTFTDIGAASNTVGITFTATGPGAGTGTASATNEVSYSDFSNTGLNRANYKSYAEQVQFNIQNGWKNPVGQIQTLNLIDFKIDRFTVEKKNTYNYDNNLVPPAWTSLPSGAPVPDPTDSKDFYILFPRPTILPNQPQYPR